LGVFFASQIYVLDRGIPWRVALSFSMPRWFYFVVPADGSLDQFRRTSDESPKIRHRA
jgi:hypothetical protein